MFANRVKLFISSFLFGFALVGAKDDNVGCIASLNGYFFDLKPLSLAINE